MKESTILNLKILGLGIVIILGASFYVSLSPITNSEEVVVKAFEQAIAEDIYPLFQCPCCGEPIAECDCPMAEERMAFIKDLTATKISKDDAIFTYVKKYSISSFIDEEKGKEFREKLVKEAPENRPIISLSTDVYDFKDVSQKDGIAVTFFEIKNTGREKLIINRLETSCGCTSASIIYNGEEGPKFNMPGHDINENIDNWGVSIAPNETAQLKVYYDPNVHPDFRGEATRSVSIYSNDPIDFQKDVQIELNQID
ncbi:DUF1573 domain-containing protein [Patescibacteria group bacterium]|nr:DUF1573 domain-containing protein [Patescibacteria group bacterium]